MSHLEEHIASLAAQLHEKDSQLRESHQALIQQSPRTSATSLSDLQVHERFEFLAGAIHDWVSTHFGSWTLRGPLDISNLPPSQRDRSNYESLLRDPQTAYLVLKGLVGEIIGQSFTSGQLLGNGAYCRLKHSLAAKGKRSLGISLLFLSIMSCCSFSSRAP